MRPLQYVILRHEGFDEPHFDLMFETSDESPLATWRSPQWPLQETSSTTYLADHRREYLEYEGPISGGRGNVRRIHQGHHIIQQNDPLVLVTQLEDGSVLRLKKSHQTGA